MTTALSPSWFSPTGRTASLKAGLTSYTSTRCCSVSGHGNLRRPRDDKCTQCLEVQTVEAKAKEAVLIEKLRLSALKWARVEVKREAARKVKQVAADKLKAEKLAIRVQAQADRDKAKRAAKALAKKAAKALEAAQGATEAPAAMPLGQSMEPVAGALVGSVSTYSVPHSAPAERR